VTPPGFSALEPAGVQSARIADLFWTYSYICAVVFVLVSGAFVMAITWRRSPHAEKTELPETLQRPRRRAVIAAGTVTTLTLVAMLVLSVMTSRALASLGTKNALAIEVIGHKWWWEVRYPAEGARLQFTTAYEIHVPVGRPVELRLTSADVIHSFWVPSLNGKRDLVPGKKTTLVLRADQAGRYEGQCAEFCGTQHANMRFVVVAESDADFQAWLDHSLSPAVTPDDPVKLRGQDVFQKSRCIACHTIAGTEAFATIGPNLTHVASRRELAMGTITNNPGHLGGWIADPQGIKPGTTMPGTPLDPEDLNALIAYLGSLK
jgi:cytochrome c oxidase subunit II